MTTVTARLALLSPGSAHVDSRVVTASLGDQADGRLVPRRDGSLCPSLVHAVADANGVAVFDLPAGVRYAFRCLAVGWRCVALVPDADCELHEIAAINP